MSDLFADLKIGDSAKFHVDGVAFLVAALAKEAIHTGRRRYAVVCTMCCADVHGATTGPEAVAEAHVRQVHLASTSST